MSSWTTFTSSSVRTMELSAELRCLKREFGIYPFLCCNQSVLWNLAFFFCTLIINGNRNAASQSSRYFQVILTQNLVMGGFPDVCVLKKEGSSVYHGSTTRPFSSFQFSLVAIVHRFNQYRAHKIQRNNLASIHQRSSSALMAP